MCCGLKSWGIFILISLLFFTGVGVPIVVRLTEFAKDAEQNIAEIIDKYGNGLDGLQISQARSDLDCDCYETVKARNVSTNSMVDLRDFDLYSSVLSLKYQGNHVHLLWDVSREEDTRFGGFIYSFKYAMWNSKECYNDPVIIVDSVTKKLGKYTLMKTPYNLFIKDKKLTCEGCKIGVLPPICV